MSNSRVDSQRKTERSQRPREAEGAQAPDDVAALENVAPRAGAGPAASFQHDDVGGQSLVPEGGERSPPEELPSPVVPMQAAFRMDIEGLAPELSANAFEAQCLADDATSLQPELGDAYLQTTQSLTQASEHASAGEPLETSQQLGVALGNLGDGVAYLADALGPAAAVVPGLLAVKQTRDALIDTKELAAAVLRAPVTAKQLLAKSVTLRSDLLGVQQRIAAGARGLEQGVKESIDNMEPGESHQLALAEEVGFGGGVGGQSEGLRIARKLDGAFVVESESKMSIGVGKHVREKAVSLGQGGSRSSTAEATLKDEGTLKLKWSATDAADARARATRLGLGQLVGNGVVANAVEFAHSREHLQSV
jgi:hypothetical protein